MRPASARRSAGCALAVALCLVIAAPAAARRGIAGTIFTVAGGGTTAADHARVATQARLDDLVLSVVARPDGSFLLLHTDGNNWWIRRVTPSGRMETLVRATGFAPMPGSGDQWSFSPGRFDVLPDGRLLIADTSGRVVAARAPGGTPTPVAGGGASDPGDGGPALQAMLLPDSVAVAADGSFLVGEKFANRVRRVAPTGVISTVAGTGVLGSSGDGGPATAATLLEPLDVAALPDGGLAIVESDRLRRVDAHGIITTVAGRHRVPAGFAGAVAAARDGDLLTTDPRHVLRLRTDGTIAHRWGGGSPLIFSSGKVFNVPFPGAPVGDGDRASDATIAPGMIPAGDVAEAADGGILIADGTGRVRYIAPAVPRLLAVAAVARGSRAGRNRYVARYRSTLPATVRWELRGAYGRIAHGRTRGRRGAGAIVVAGAFRPGPYTLALTAAAGARRAAALQRVFLGGLLPVPWARRAADLTETVDLETEGSAREPAGCRRFGPARVDCVWRITSVGISNVDSIRLRRDGQISVRRYRASRRVRLRDLRPHPRGLSAAELMDLESLRRRR